MAFVVLRLRLGLHARMKIKRRVELGHRCPEIVEFRHVVIEAVVGRILLGEAVHHRALEAQLLDAAGQFRGRRVGVLHRQGGEGGVMVGMILDGLRHLFVGLFRHLDGLVGVEDPLHARRIERQNGHFDARLFHLFETVVPHVQQFLGEFAEIRRFARERTGFLDGFLDADMLLEGDLSFHRGTPLVPDFL